MYYKITLSTPPKIKRFYFKVNFFIKGIKEFINLKRFENYSIVDITQKMNFFELPFV